MSGWGGGGGQGYHGGRGGGKRNFEGHQDWSGKRYRGEGGGRGWGQGDDRRFDKRAAQPPRQGPGAKKIKTKDDEIRAQLKALLVRVGDFHHISTTLSSLEENVEGLAGALADELGPFGDFIVDFLLTAASQLSMQTPVYATLVGLVNARDEEFGAKVVRGAHQRLHQFITEGRWVNAKLILRLLAELVNARVVKPEGEGSLGELVTILLAPVKDPRVAPARKDLYLQLVASTLPWVWDALIKEWPDRLPELLRDMFAYADTRTPMYRKDGVKTVLEAGLDEGEAEEEDGAVGGKAPGEPVQDSIETAVAVVRQLAATLEEGVEALDINAIVKPWKTFKDTLLQGRRHAIPVLIVPDPDPAPDNPAPQPLPFNPLFAEFDIFDEGSGAKAGTVAKLGSVERWVLREYLKDMLVTFRPFVTDGGIRRGSYKAECEQLLSISYLAPPDVATEHLVVEAMLLWLVQSPGRDLAYMHRLMVQLVHTSKAAAALALGLHLVFQDFLEVLDPVATIQLASWFGSHLTNTQFVYPYWEVWAEQVTDQQAEQDDHPQLFFLRRALDVAARLTFVSKVMEATPAALHHLIPGEPYAVSPYLPPEASEDPAEGDTHTTRTLKELIRMLKMVLQGMTPPDHVRAWLEAPHPYVDAEQPDEPLWRIVLLAHGISRIADNTVAHLPSLVEKCLSWLRSVFEADEHQVRIVEALAQVWYRSPQMCMLALDAVMRMHVVLPVNLVSWAFRDVNVRRFGREVVFWDMISDAIDRSLESVANYAEAVQKALHDARYTMGVVVDVNDEDAVRRFVPKETLDYGVVAAENAQDLAFELFEAFANALDSPLQSPADRDAQWVRVALSYYKGALRKYLKLLRSPLNTAIPTTEPIFSFPKFEQVMQPLVSAPQLSDVMADARRLVSEAHDFGGDFAHGKIFSEEE